MLGLFQENGVSQVTLKFEDTFPMSICSLAESILPEMQ